MPPQSPPEPPAPPALPSAPPAEPAVDPTPQPQIQPQPQSQPQPYDFITHPGEPSGGISLSLPGSDSTIMRAIYFGGGLLVLLVLFLIVKGILSNNPGATLFTGIAQDQQELIHLATNAGKQPGLTTSNQNFAATSQSSLTSAQSAIIKAILGSGAKLKVKTLDLKVSATTDAQLASAATAGTYDQTFQTVMNTKLEAYVGDLKQAYAKTGDKNSRALFSNDYKQAQLLITQLNTPIN